MRFTMQSGLRKASFKLYDVRRSKTDLTFIVKNSKNVQLMRRKCKIQWHRSRKREKWIKMPKKRLHTTLLCKKAIDSLLLTAKVAKEEASKTRRGKFQLSVQISREKDFETIVTIEEQKIQNSCIRYQTHSPSHRLVQKIEPETDYTS